jgi:hypothetical protein
MGLLKSLLIPIRRIAHFPLFQLALAVAVILWLQAGESSSLRGQTFDLLDRLVEFSVERCAAVFSVKAFTRSWLTAGFMIGYVYLTGLILLFLGKLLARAAVELTARFNAFGLRYVIARERGIAAYRAWLPLERIRPRGIPQEQWEEMFAWPADNRPPYPSIAWRAGRALVTYVILVLIVAALLQAFTPFPALTWLGELASRLSSGRH